MRGIALILVASCCFAFHPQNAAAQAEILMLRLCKKITDDAARLKCFDALVSETPQNAAVNDKERPAPQWEVTDSRSPIDDSPQVTAILSGSQGKAALLLRCKEKRTEAAIMYSDLFIWERGTVLLRVNDLPPATGSWTAAQNNKAVFAPNGQTFVKMLPDNGTLFVRTTGRSSSEDATFQLGDVSAVRDRISAACRWNAAAATPSAPTTPTEGKPAPTKKAKPSASASDPIAFPGTGTGTGPGQYPLAPTR